MRVFRLLGRFQDGEAPFGGLAGIADGGGPAGMRGRPYVSGDQPRPALAGPARQPLYEPGYDGPPRFEGAPSSSPEELIGAALASAAAAGLGLWLRIAVIAAAITLAHHQRATDHHQATEDHVRQPDRRIVVDTNRDDNEDRDRLSDNGQPAQSYECAQADRGHFWT